MENPVQTTRLNKIVPLLLGILIALVVIALVFMVREYKVRRDLEKTQTNSSLEISTPENFTATNQSKIKLAGQAKGRSYITINSNKKQLILDSQNGEFSTDLELSEGKNTISITAYNPDTGQAQTATKEVLYINEDLNSLWKGCYFS